MKRSIDIAIAALVLLVFSPLLVVAAVLIRINLGTPVLFAQIRTGLNAQPFKMIKFRTMRDATGPDGRPLPDADRLTRLGQFMRSASFDELPSFVNVLKGELSLVGPRPLLMEYVPLYSPEQARRHEVRPGITGWAQINGRNAIGWDEKFALDVWYVENRSIWLDLKIIALTAVKVVARHGISAQGEATMSKFAGNERSE